MGLGRVASAAFVHDGDALTEVFIDGARAGASTLANMAGRRVDHVNFGNTGIATQCSDKGSTYVDRVSVSDGPIGPLPAMR